MMPNASGCHIKSQLWCSESQKRDPSKTSWGVKYLPCLLMLLFRFPEDVFLQVTSPLKSFVTAQLPRILSLECIDVDVNTGRHSPLFAWMISSGFDVESGEATLVLKHVKNLCWPKRMVIFWRNVDDIRTWDFTNHHDWERFPWLIRANIKHWSLDFKTLRCSNWATLWCKPRCFSKFCRCSIYSENHLKPPSYTCKKTWKSWNDV